MSDERKVGTPFPRRPRRTFLKWLGTTVSTFATASFLPPPQTANAEEAPKLLKVTTSFNPEFIITAAEEMKKIAEETKTIAENTLKELGLEKMVRQVWLTPTEKLKVENKYGVNFEKNGTHAGYVFVRPNGKSVVVIGISPKPEDVKSIMRHEASHILDPRYGGIDYLTGDISEDIAQKYGLFREFYERDILAQGRYIDTYDRDIINGGAIEIGRKIWPFFAKVLAISENDTSNASISQVESILKNQELPNGYKYILNSFVSGTKTEPTKIFDILFCDEVGIQITKLYWQGVDVLSVFSPELQKYLENRIRHFGESAEIEAWAVLGKKAFENPRLTRQMYPQFSQAFETIYYHVHQKLRGLR